MKLSKRIERVKPSMTLAIAARAKALKREGKDVKDFGAGEPDAPTPETARNAGKLAIEKGFTGYTASDGIPELKEAVIKRMKIDYDFSALSHNVIITSGGKQGLFNFFMACIEAGDEVIIPAPYWVSYPEMTAMADGTPVIVNTKAENNFCLTAEEFEKHYTPKTKAIIINSPSNPTGGAYSESALKDLAKALKDKDIVIITDDIYHRIVYSGFTYKHLVQVEPELADRILFVDGVSKAYSMTGWRIGWAVGDKEIIAAMKKVSDQSTSCPCSVSQKAAVAALEGEQKPCAEMLANFERRKNLIVEGLNRIKEVSCRDPQGAFYAFPNIEKLIGRYYRGKQMKDDIAICQTLLEEKLVACVFGSSFGAPGYMRFSFATDDETILEGLRRFEGFVNELEEKG